MPSEQQQGNDLGARGVKRQHDQPRCVRINLHDLKGRLLKVLGPKKDKEYCALFSSFLSQRLSKAELDERLLQTLGRDNIGLHNDIVKAVLRNATCGEVPPPHLVPDKSRRGSAIRSIKPELVEVDTRSPTSPLQVSSTPRRTGVSSYEDSEDGLDVCSSRQEEAEEGPLAKRPRLPEEEQETVVPLYVRSHRRRARKPPVWRPEEDEPEEWLEPGMLPDAPAMQSRMERLAEGLDGVQLESANLLNHAVDAHLRRLIRACIELVQARRSRRPKQPAAAEETEPISIIDFKVAVELNPRQLGEDWPLQLERISMRAPEHHFD